MLQPGKTGIAPFVKHKLHHGIMKKMKLCFRTTKDRKQLNTLLQLLKWSQEQSNGYNELWKDSAELGYLINNAFGSLWLIIKCPINLKEMLLGAMKFYKTTNAQANCCCLLSPYSSRVGWVEPTITHLCLVLLRSLTGQPNLWHLWSLCENEGWIEPWLEP